jgi:nucleotide-binding universal stress UspA family protein
MRAEEEKLTGQPAQVDQIIVTLDGSDLSSQALPHASALAKAVGAKLTLLRIVPLMVYGSTVLELPRPEYDELRLEAKASAADCTEGLLEALDKEGVTDVEQAIFSGPPGISILGYVKDKPNHLVVMTTHGRSGLARFIMGSAADRVIRHSSGPVLIVRSGQ